ncbi:MAG: ABC transporter ATP-binding protein [Myxococcota bacterium]
MGTLALSAEGISKRYGACTANADANLHVATGTIHALVGENGAGKSTLCKTLFGLIRPDTGEIRIHGEPARLTGPRDAMARGLGMVHQHFMLVPTLSVAENVALGQEPRAGLFIDHQRARADVTTMSERFGLQVDPDALVEDLPVGVQQRVEILKVLHQGARILILDEPTAVLTPPEVESLFAVLRRLKAEGRTVVLVTHKLPEVLALCDAVTVMRAGRTVAEQPTAGLTVDELARLMVGRNVALDRKPRGTTPGEERLVVRELRVRRADGRVAVDGVSLTVRAGEVVGIAGVEGNGQTELADAICGVLPATGAVLLQGRDVSALDVLARRQAGLAHVPEDRLTAGLVPTMRVSENAVLGKERTPPFSRAGLLSGSAVASLSRALIDAFDIRPPDPAQLAGALSGGNQQKIVVGRELHGDPRVLVLAQPTRGVDVGAIERIHQAILTARDAGLAILLFSAELTELLALSDVIHVMYRGRLVKTVPGDGATEELLGPAMLGGA